MAWAHHLLATYKGLGGLTKHFWNLLPTDIIDIVSLPQICSNVLSTTIRFISKYLPPSGRSSTFALPRAVQDATLQLSERFRTISRPPPSYHHRPPTVGSAGGSLLRNPVLGLVYRTCPGTAGRPDIDVTAETCGSLCGCKNALGRASDLDCNKAGVPGTTCSALDLIRSCKCGDGKNSYDPYRCDGTPCWCGTLPPSY